MEEAKGLVRESLAQTNAIWEAHAADACVKALVDRDWAGAGIAWDKALSLPGGHEVRKDTFYLSYLASQRENDKLLGLVREKFAEGGYRVATDRTDVALFYFLGGDRNQAERLLRDNIELHPDYYLGYLHLALVLEQDRPQEAVTILKRIRLKPRQVGVTWGMKAFLLGRCGHTGRAKLLLRTLTTKRRLAKYLPASRGASVPASQIALAAIGADRLEEAVGWFKVAVEERDPLMDWLAIAPYLRALHSLNSFTDLVSSIGLKLPPGK
jgi:tetratricopeptide (TPR) repeat protein